MAKDAVAVARLALAPDQAHNSKLKLQQSIATTCNKSFAASKPNHCTLVQAASGSRQKDVNAYVNAYVNVNASATGQGLRICRENWPLRVDI